MAVVVLVLLLVLAYLAVRVAVENKVQLVGRQVRQDKGMQVGQALLLPHTAVVVVVDHLLWERTEQIPQGVTAVLERHQQFLEYRLLTLEEEVEVQILAMRLVLVLVAVVMVLMLQLRQAERGL